ncbi:glycine cleavage system protein H [Roseateles saccharophilus]|uniref:Glycine cleavage system H lipoate-binding protein n=1 Tax=Roseateles saccharophilus TaxID=304 RepID=A0A4R3UAL8_ROSSA|nr:glycine cleavage system protein H [Roseateles saccharophilus]MDG0835559.1 glycine cleavage system protein H [Roseateles saccharophilus]TCU85473.1 glycine cleavage system H lipoate-binding protein [Roseateles saccharophilus]
MLIAGAEVPEGFWLWAEDQTWAQPLPDGKVRIGITALGLKASGDIYMCRPKPVGSDVAQGRSIGVVELAKSIVSVKSPLSGRVVRVNEALEERPELVHQSPYEAGWLVELAPSALEAEKAGLAIGAEAIGAAMQEWAWLNRLADKP